MKWLCSVTARSGNLEALRGGGCADREMEKSSRPDYSFFINFYFPLYLPLNTLSH